MRGDCNERDAEQIEELYVITQLAAVLSAAA